MKLNTPLLIFVLLLSLLPSCKKDAPEITPLASLKIINVVTGGTSAKVGGYFSIITNNSNSNYSLYPGFPSIYVYPSTDSLQPYYNPSKSEEILPYVSYALFLGGTPTNITSIFLREDIPVRTDSTCGVRFVNLGVDSPPVNVTLSTSTSVSEFFNIGYGQMTDFKTFAAANSNTSYTFQVRNAATNAIITSITMSGTTVTTYVPRFKNVTLVLRGKIGGTPAPGITRVNHY